MQGFLWVIVTRLLSPQPFSIRTTDDGRSSRNKVETQNPKPGGTFGVLGLPVILKKVDSKRLAAIMHTWHHVSPFKIRPHLGF